MKHDAERNTLYWLIFKGRALGGPEKAYVDTMDVQTLWRYMQWLTEKAARCGLHPTADTNRKAHEC